MVKVTEKYLIRKLGRKPQIQPKKKGETDYEYLSRITHLYLQSQFVDQIAPVTDCSSVSVIYLQNNQLQTIHNMENFPNLSYLYLQNNHISRIENLNFLKNLKKLYLGSNEISVLEGLDGLGNLTELHIENQRLPEGETLYFDPRTMKSLARTLTVLNITQNNITSLQGLSGMSKLEDLIAGNNKMDDLEDVSDTVSSLQRLRKLKLSGNPIAWNRKYREALILASKSLRLLDDTEIAPETRTFLENFVMRKESRSQPANPIPRSSSDYRTRREKIPDTISGSKLFPELKMHMLRMPRTVSTFSATVPSHYFHQSLRTFPCGSTTDYPSLNFK